LTANDDIRRLELKVSSRGNAVSQRLVFAGTEVDVGRQVYALHDRLAATGYNVRCKTPSIGLISGAGQPTYGVVMSIEGGHVTLEEMPTSPSDPPLGKGKQTVMSGAYFLEHYEVD
jgi:hypothetical protein